MKIEKYIYTYNKLVEMIEAFYNRMYTILQRESGTTDLFKINFTFHLTF